MNTFEFTLKIGLPKSTDDAEVLLSALAEAGCTDALVGIGRQGRIALNFSRQADDAYTAITSALEEVKKAIPNAKLLEVAPDLVGISDVAEIVGVSRQAMRKMIESRLADFPIAMHDGNPSLWRLADVMFWHMNNNQSKLDQALYEVAVVAKESNIARDYTSVSKGEHFSQLVKQMAM